MDVTVRVTLELTIPLPATGDDNTSSSPAGDVEQLLAQIEREVLGPKRSNLAPNMTFDIKVTTENSKPATPPPVVLTGEAPDDAGDLCCNEAPEYDGLHHGTLALFDEGVTR